MPLGNVKNAIIVFIFIVSIYLINIFFNKSTIFNIIGIGAAFVQLYIFISMEKERQRERKERRIDIWMVEIERELNTLKADIKKFEKKFKSMPK